MSGLAPPHFDSGIYCGRKAVAKRRISHSGLGHASSCPPYVACCFVTESIPPQSLNNPHALTPRHTPLMTQGAPTPANDDTTPAALWDAARYAMRWLVNLFGAPTDLADFTVLTPNEHRDLLSWLRPLEALVRSLLLIKAAEMPAPERAARRGKTAPRRSRRLVEQDPETSERWRVSFRALPPVRRPGSRRRASSADLPSAWPLAERLEAVIRVLENPSPFARRLARRLRARPDLAPRALRLPPDEPSRRPGEWAWREAWAQALGVVAVFDTG